MKAFRLTARYMRDYKLIAKRGYNLDAIDTCRRLQSSGGMLAIIAESCSR